jgi:hypothetical protein
VLSCLLLCPPLVLVIIHSPLLCHLFTLSLPLPPCPFPAPCASCPHACCALLWLLSPSCTHRASWSRADEEHQPRATLAAYLDRYLADKTPHRQAAQQAGSMVRQGLRRWGEDVPEVRLFAKVGGERGQGRGLQQGACGRGVMGRGWTQAYCQTALPHACLHLTCWPVPLLTRSPTHNPPCVQPHTR